MTGWRRFGFGIAALTLTLAVAAAGVPQQQPPPSTVKIGMAGSLFKDVPASMVKVMTPPFQSLMRDQTGLNGDILAAGDAHDLGRRLHDNDVHLGVFHGFEFAWAQEKYPDLRPLMIAVNRHKTLRAYLVIRIDNEAGGLGDLKGKTLAVPRKTREHCLLFLERECKAHGAASKEFFSDIVSHSSIEDALDDILRDKVQAALVDAIALESYEQVKSGCFARLKVLKQSEPFPPGVVAYREGALDAGTLKKFRDGMVNANMTARGRELMAMWKLTAFETIPRDFQETLGTILKAYPAPAASVARDKDK